METVPKINKHLKDLKCCDGDAVTLECHVIGNPEPNILWEKDGCRLQMTSDISAQFNGDRATLSISRIYAEDEGEYTMMAENSLGKSFSSAYIIVDAPEDKENVMSRQLVRPQGLMPPSGYSTPRSTPRSTPARSISPYPMSYRNIDINAKPKVLKYQAPKFYSQPQNRVVEEGTSIRFQCVIGGHPLPWSTWDKNGDIVVPSGRVRIMDRDDLRILDLQHVTMADSGLYRITLENEYGRIESTARLDVICGRKRSTRLQRAVSASPRRPYYWTRRLRGNSTAIGGRLVLACDIRGKSLPPTKRYYCNGEELQESYRVRIVENGFLSHVIIDPVMKSDEGVYMCVVEYNSESDSGVLVSSTGYLQFDDGTSEKVLAIEKGLQEKYMIEEGLEADLLCLIECSNGDYDYKWLRNGQPVPNGDDFLYIDHGNGILALRFNDPFLLDSGEYICQIKSACGEVLESKCEVQVIEKDCKTIDKAPVFTKLPWSAYTRSGSDVSFVCRVEPENTEVQWFVNGQEMNNKDDKIGVRNEYYE